MDNKLMEELEELLGKCDTRHSSVINLTEHLKNNGYYTAPASTSKHNSFRGGLLEHSMGVTRTLLVLKEALLPAITDESCVIVGLFHDAHKVCDTFDNAYYTENKLKNGELSGAKPYKINSNSFQLHGGTMSAMVVRDFIKLSPSELQAIIYHDGQYVMANRDVQHKETTLTLLLHWADMWNASQIEKSSSDYYSVLNGRV